MLEAIITSKIRREILARFLLTPHGSFHIRDLGRLVHTEINAVRRELLKLSKIGMLKKRHSGNRIYYEATRDFILVNPLIKILALEYGLGGELIRERENIGNIKFALLSLEFVRGRTSNSSQVDLLLVGDVKLSALEKIIQEAQGFLEREINYMTLTDEEFGFQKSRRDPMLLGAISQARIILWGDEERYCGLV